MCVYFMRNLKTGLARALLIVEVLGAAHGRRAESRVQGKAMENIKKAAIKARPRLGKLRAGSARFLESLVFARPVPLSKWNGRCG